jgi:hypothetical protein
LTTVLQSIQLELAELNRQFKRIIEPEVSLNHYARGAAIRVDDSHSQRNNPTF